MKMELGAMRDSCLSSQEVLLVARMLSTSQREWHPVMSHKVISGRLATPEG